MRPEVVAEAGQEVTLPCRLTPGPGVMVSQVTWLRGAGPRKTSLAVFHPALGPSYPQGAPGRARFLKPSLDEPSLVLGPLIPSDDDTYTCEFATFPHGNEDGVTRLLVLGEWPRSCGAWGQGALVLGSRGGRGLGAMGVCGSPRGIWEPWS